MKFEGPESVKIKRVPTPGYFGITSYSKSVTTLGSEISKTGFSTGLTPEEEKYFESELNLKPGELNKHSKWWGEVFNTEYALRLNNTKATELTLDNPINQLRYKVLMASSKVAKTELEKNPNHVFFVDNAEAKAIKEMESFNYEFEGAGLIHKLAPEDKRGALRLFGKTGLDNLSEAMLNAQLYKEMKNDPKAFVAALTDKNIKTSMLIKELVEKGIIKRKGNYYIHNDDTIAHSTEECISYFNDVENQSVKLILEGRLKKEKKVKA